MSLSGEWIYHGTWFSNKKRNALPIVATRWVKFTCCILMKETTSKNRCMCSMFPFIWDSRENRLVATRGWRFRVSWLQRLRGKFLERQKCSISWTLWWWLHDSVHLSKLTELQPWLSGWLSFSRRCIHHRNHDRNSLVRGKKKINELDTRKYPQEI